MADSTSTVRSLDGPGGWRASHGSDADAGGIGKEPGDEPVPAGLSSGSSGSVESAI